MQLPAAFTERIRRTLGNEAGQLLDALEHPPVVSVRMHPRKAAAATISGNPVPWNTEAFYLEERPVFTLDPAFHAGAYYVQDASSMFLRQALDQTLDASKNLYILDLCAAPGGKSTLISAWLNGKGLLVSNEVIRSRASVLKENTIRWGYSNTAVTCNDPRDFAAAADFFDAIVIDAPCSGEGLFRKDPDAITEWSPQNCAICESRQQRITEDVIASLKPGGVLIYSTCTYNPGENIRNAGHFITELGMEPLSLSVDPAWNIREERGDAGSIGYAFLPHLAKGEGFFLSCFRKPYSADDPFVPAINKKQFLPASKESVAAAARFAATEGLFLHDFKGDIFGFPQELLQAMHILYAHLRVVSGGVFIGTPKGKDFVPAHALSQSDCLGTGFPHLALDKKEALNYLARQTFAFPAETPDGWLLITYNGAALGWAKKIGHRINNYYPIELRIRMTLPE